MRTNLFTPPLDIQRSKDTTQVLQESKVGNTNLFLGSFSNPKKNIMFQFFIDRKINQGFCLITNFLKNGASINDNGTNSLAINKARSSFKLILMRIILVINNYTTQKNNIMDGVGPQLFFKLAFLLFHPHFSLIQSILSKLVDDWFQDVS